MNSVRAVPVALLRHLGQTLDIATPDLASLRALYARGRTLFDHQQQACEVLGFAWMSEHQRRALVGVIVFFLQIDTLTQKNSSRDKHLQNRLSETPCAFSAD